jgi:hypothetical protein
MWIQRLYAKRWVKIPYLIALYSFAIYGAFLAAVYVAMKFKLTQEAGQLDANNRYFQSMHDKYNQDFRVDSTYLVKKRFEVLDRVLLLNDFYPYNARYIMNSFKDHGDEILASKMLDAVDLSLKDDRNYQEAIKDLKVQNDSLQARLSALEK